jgi:hypothetical protein
MRFPWVTASYKAECDCLPDNRPARRPVATNTQIPLYPPLEKGEGRTVRTVPLYVSVGGSASHVRVFCGGRGNRFFAKKGFPHSFPSVRRSLYTRIGVVEDNSTVGVGLDHVALAVNFPSLGDQGVARIYHPGETGA